MGWFRRSEKRGGTVRLRSAERIPGELERRGEQFKRYRLEIDFRAQDGAEHSVERKMWVPVEYSPEGVAESGRELSAIVTGPADSDPEEIEIYWMEVDESLSKDDFVKLFHKQGLPGERLELLERLNDQGFFTPEQYENGRRELLAELGDT
ncbi:MAG: hypothetical protein ACR2G3_01110 [Solirubrobacterales bacterium]